MDYFRKIAGWDRAANKYIAGLPQRAITVTRITLEEAAEMAATQHRIQQRPKAPLTTTSNLVGKEFGILLAYDRVEVPGTGTPPDYILLCGCGKYCNSSANALLRGRKTHCGCRTRERKRVRAYRLKKSLERKGRKRQHWKKHWAMKCVRMVTRS
jgi:hypothetical protein